ncbi:MAG: 30S ribosomal protein S8 [Flavobacteriales bacterium]|nr:30S ribosomal protein S8 [Flavobacteriales bacterium]
MYTDTIADFLTRIRNAQRAKHRLVQSPNSKIKSEIARILKDQGFIIDYKVIEDNKQGVIKLALKYNEDNDPVIKNISRVSKPGLRKYAGSQKLPRVINGLGIAILTTSQGVMTNKEAKIKNIGGEVLCYVY